MSRRKRSKPTSVRMWPDDERFIRRLAEERRIPMNQVVDEAIALLRKKVETEISGRALFEAVEGAAE